MSTTHQLSVESSFYGKKNGLSEFLLKQKEAEKATKTISKGSFERDASQFTSIIVEPNSSHSSMLKNWITKLFPEINNLANVDNLYDARHAILHHELDLIFSDAGVVKDISSINEGKRHYEIISMSDRPEDAIHALRNNMCGFISKPLEVNEVTISVQCALNKLMKVRNAYRSHDDLHLPHNKLVGVPTMEGIEFINTDEIIRCEGLQKCTRIVTIEKTDVISSYNIGEFKKLLEGRGFFSCHKSHLINLKFVKKYTREGFIFFNANSKPVPLARRRKCDFLNQMKHL